MSDTEKALKSVGGSETKEVLTKGGVKGWLTVLSGWCVMLNTFDYISAFGPFLIDKSESNIAWIGSLQAFFMFSAGLISGLMIDGDRPKNTAHPNSMLMLFITSVMLTSLCTEYYQFILAQGVLRGPPNGLAYTPAVTAINQYFFQKRPIEGELHLADPPSQA
ncbi:MFS monocarboxylate transporter [Penicillium canescens]|uniref:MFS monocarboxylate transporter n=1 Tax=Penicillium canescens TaxID=5083 RepID=A0AAD6I357_PENCN|nr:MFS monocarboxylate transporter [Penicillium canescens]KAJ6027607.1 MFS monocarboxylate transporter [Penicillium canescens]KAJ6040885.1 MFS monocarboxylate transporter [Penicillium canescens]KAJ6066760.1 MFS monocarboxylate transporter [Penicillium canescens]